MRSYELQRHNTDMCVLICTDIHVIKDECAVEFLHTYFFSLYFVNAIQIHFSCLYAFIMRCDEFWRRWALSSEQSTYSFNIIQTDNGTNYERFFCPLHSKCLLLDQNNSDIRWPFVHSIIISSINGYRFKSWIQISDFILKPCFENCAHFDPKKTYVQLMRILKQL